MVESNTGLAQNLRTWMQGKGNAGFERRKLVKAFAGKGFAAQTVKWAFRSFVRRGEVKETPDGLYFYDRTYRTPALKSLKRDRIHKTVYVINRAFTSADILALSDLDKTASSLIVQTLRNLARAGYLRRIGRQGNAKLYRLSERERFRMELLQKERGKPPAPRCGGETYERTLLETVR